MIPRHTKQRILLRAINIIGDGELVAYMLGVGRVQMDAWTMGFLELPDEHFLKTVEICLEYGALALGPAKRATAQN